MYKLFSSDKTNDKEIELALKYTKRAQELKDTMTPVNIAYAIFKEDLNEKSFRTLAVSLSLGDELKTPITKDIADILYFALVNNYYNVANSGSKITNLIQAKTLYEFSENDYTKIILDDNKNTKRFTELKGRHSVLFPGYDVIWKIPVSFFKSKGIGYVTLSGLNYCLLVINNVEHKIPRLMYQRFFKDSMIKGRLCTLTTEELKEKFNLEDLDTLKLCFECAGYTIISKYKDIPLPLGNVYIEDYKINVLTKERVSLKTEPNVEFWEQIGMTDRFILLPKIDYIPIRSKEIDRVLLFIKK